MRRNARIMLAAFLLTSSVAGAAAAADLKIVAMRKAKDVVVTVKSESGQWAQGANSFVLEFTSAKTNEPVDAGTVSLGTSMSMPGMAPMLAGAALTGDKTPGRYLGQISFPDSGDRQVTVRWDGPAGKGSARFTVPVR